MNSSITATLQRSTIVWLISAAPLLTAALPTNAQTNGEVAPGFLFNVYGGVRHDDNVYRLDFEEESDTVLVVQPELTWVTLSGAHQFDLSYAGDYGAYASEDNLDFDNHKFGAHAGLDHTARLRSDYTAVFQRDYDAPGSTDASNINLPGESPNEWERTVFNAKIEYGNTNSAGQLVGQVKHSKLRYEDSDQEFRDFDLTGGTGTFYYRIAARTRLLFEVDYNDYDYDNQDFFGSDQSSKQYRYLTGATWEATAKTTGVFKIGFRDRQFDNNNFADLNGLYFSLDGKWEPTSYTTVTVAASQDNQESAQQTTGGFVRTAFNAKLNHDLTPRTRLTSTVGFRNDDFEGNFNRSDDRWDLALGLQYSLLHWLDIGAEYRYEDRSSDLEIFDFKANIITVNVSTQFGP